MALCPAKPHHGPNATDIGGNATRSSAFSFAPSSSQENPSTLSFLVSPVSLSSFPFRFPPARFIPSHPTICLVHLHSLIQSPRSYHLASVPRLIYFGAAGFCAAWVGTPGNCLDLISRPERGARGVCWRCPAGIAPRAPPRQPMRGKSGPPTLSPAFCLWIINGHQCLGGKPALNPGLALSCPPKQTALPLWHFCLPQADR